MVPPYNHGTKFRNLWCCGCPTEEGDSCYSVGELFDPGQRKLKSHVMAKAVWFACARLRFWPKAGEDTEDAELSKFRG
jgi:hypothetical protein